VPISGTIAFSDLAPHSFDARTPWRCVQGLPRSCRVRCGFHSVEIIRRNYPSVPALPAHQYNLRCFSAYFASRLRMESNSFRRAGGNFG
jgi:hypothetical protein